MNPSVTVIILVYKVEDFFEQCVESLYGQSLQNIEYIFVDDCTPDRSMDILSTVLQRYPHRASQTKIVRHAENKGAATARNTGLSMAHGEYVIYCDGDDWVELDMYEKMYEQAVENKSDIVWCDFMLNYPNGREIIERQFISENRNSIIRGLLSGRIHGGNCNKLVRTDLYLRYNILFPDGHDMMEDLVVTIQLFYYALKVKYLSMPLYYYRQNQKSLSRNSDCDKVQQRCCNQLVNAEYIISFLNGKGITGKDMVEVQYFKLFSKMELLQNKKTLRQWRVTFSDANKYVFSCPKITFKSKVLQWCLAHGFWWIYNLKKIS